MNKISHSASNLYQDCAFKYKLHYKNRLRSKTQSAALFFGTAIDRSLASMLEKGDYISKFLETWEKQELNNKPIDLKYSTEIVYANSDYDEELLNPSDIKELGVSLDVINTIYSEKQEKGFDGLELADKELLNYANWLCLRQKGLLMLECFKKNILPQITEVNSLQEKIELKNSEEDVITGYIDLVAKFKGHDQPIIFDFKTATRQYEDDAVLKSTQLALYTHALSKKYNTNKAGFIVLHKTIKKNRVKTCSSCNFDGTGARFKTCNNEVNGKRCDSPWVEKITPEATYQILINDIPAKTQDLVVQNMDEINHAIKQEVFPRNLSSCVKPYGKCQYYKLCWEGKDETLIELPKTS